MSTVSKFLYALRPAKSLLRVNIGSTPKFNTYYLCQRQNLHFKGHHRSLSSQPLENAKESASEGSKDSGPVVPEKPTGEKSTHQFQANTKALLDIVAKTLYSEKEVFLRELISNASDALEKLRYFSITNQLPNQSENPPNYEIRVTTDKQNRFLIIQDSGIGMTEEELTKNLGTIAQSGSKAFLNDLKDKGGSSTISEVIGQFGVGFYSAFMVADRVEVYTKSYKDNEGHYWFSDGSGSYEIAKADNVQTGTKIVLHLRPECREYSDEATVTEVINKYSNFINSPIYINGKQTNFMKPLWLCDPNEVTKEQHVDFYQFIGNTKDEPRFTLHYVTDVPLGIRALLYFPKHKSNFFDLNVQNYTGVALYCKKVLIKNKMQNILPNWLRFAKGVVDSEDIPLNLSRELLQDNVLIFKLRNVLTMRVIKYLQERSNKEREEYMEFYKDYQSYLKEGIITSNDPSEREGLGKLLRYESSACKQGETTSFADYKTRMAEGQKEIFYLTAPNRVLAEQSPYMESFKKRNIEVIFCYEPYDEVVLMHLRQLDGKVITSLEKDLAYDQATTQKDKSIIHEEIKATSEYIKSKLSGKIFEVRTTDRLENHPCAVTVPDMPSARHFIRTQSHQFNEEIKYQLLQPKLEINPNHPIIKNLSKLRTSDPEIADLLTNQLFIGAMVSAGLVEDSRVMLTTVNDLLTKLLAKNDAEKQ